LGLSVGGSRHLVTRGGKTEQLRKGLLKHFKTFFGNVGKTIIGRVGDTTRKSGDNVDRTFKNISKPAAVLLITIINILKPKGGSLNVPEEMHRQELHRQELQRRELGLQRRELQRWQWEGRATQDRTS